MNDCRRKVVLGLGNILNKDEGLGVHALKQLSQQLNEAGYDFAGLELLDGGTLGLKLLPIVEECSHLLILDAVNAGKPPGTLIELSRTDIRLYSGIKMSEHQVSFQEVLGLATFRGRFPESLHLIGIQPADMSIGVVLSQPVSTRMHELVELAIGKLQDWRLIKPIS